MTLHVTIQWTATARSLLADLPKTIRKGLIRKIGSLQNSDPRQAGKPLIGPLEGFRSITHGRYRAIFRVHEVSLDDADIKLVITVHVEVVGIRKDRDKHDVYKVAKKLAELGLIPGAESAE